MSAGSSGSVTADVVLAGADGVPPPLTPLRLLTDWQPDVLVVTGLVLVALLYVAGVARLARRGHPWPVGRTLSFLVGGVGVAAVAMVSGLAAYDDVLFSAHMAQHMLLTMVAPVFLALGAPVTLALRTLPPAGRRRLLAVLHSRVAKVLLHPLVGGFLFVLTPFVLYFSPLYEASLRSDPLHALLHVHFLLVGCLFLWPLLGLDPLPQRLPHPLRLVLLFVTLPFHAFLGISIMSGSTVIAQDWYAGLHRTWGDTLLADQHLGGGLLWASGDLLGLLLVGAVAVQWMQADERAARREDRRLDRLERLASAASARGGARAAPTPAGAGARASAAAGGAGAGVSAAAEADPADREDAALAAYNARLAALARRDARTS